MKRTLMLMLSASLAIAPVVLSAHSKPVHSHISKPRRINMTGPSPISATGTGYMYNVNLMGQALASDAIWSVINTSTGERVNAFPASAPVGNTASITLNGVDFGPAGNYVLYLIGTTPDGVTIYGSKTIIVH
jgi:hypothetical protein